MTKNEKMTTDNNLVGNKKEFITFIAEQRNITKKESESILNSLLDGIEYFLNHGKRKVSFLKWGSFAVIERKPRKFMSIKERTFVLNPAKNIIKFKVGKELGERIAKK